MGVRQRCLITPWLFNLFMDRVVKEMKEARIDNAEVKISTDDTKCKLNTVLFADDTDLLVDEMDLQILVAEFKSNCKRTKLKVNVENSKLIGFQKRFK